MFCWFFSFWNRSVDDYVGAHLVSSWSCFVGNRMRPRTLSRRLFQSLFILAMDFKEFSHEMRTKKDSSIFIRPFHQFIDRINEVKLNLIKYWHALFIESKKKKKNEHNRFKFSILIQVHFCLFFFMSKDKMQSHSNLNDLQISQFETIKD